MHRPIVDPDAPPDANRCARIALAHDWLCGVRGGEAVLDRFALIAARLGEPAGLYVMTSNSTPHTPAIDALRVTTSFLQHIPGASGPLRRWMLPLYPAAVADLGRRLLREHERNPIDLLLSTSSSAIKGLRAPPGVPHVCYCHAPARYVWSLTDDYARTNALRGLGLHAVRSSFQRWDRRTASHVDLFIANSSHIAREIGRCFGREAIVIHPPVRTEQFTPDPSIKRESFWLVVSALEPYKRVDLAIEAANRERHELVVIGAGSESARLRELAGPTVRLLGRVDDGILIDHYRRARLLIFPQVEDFGIVAPEAQACGLPVVARRAGGALDSVVEGVTGSFFDTPTVDSLLDAITGAPGDDVACRTNAMRFAEDAFDRAISELVVRVLSGPLRASPGGSGGSARPRRPGQGDSVA